MLKRLAILGLLALSLTGGAWPQAPRDGSQQNQLTQGEQNNAKPIQPSPSAIQLHTSSAKQEQKIAPKPSGYPWKELLAPANVPNWLLAAFAGWAGVMALRTLGKIGRQGDLMNRQNVVALATARAAQQSAKAAAISADAALAQIQTMQDQASVMERQTAILETSVAIAKKSAEAFVNSERARLAVDYSETEESVFRFQVKNSGRSPALIKFALVRFHILDSDEAFPHSPDYLDEEEDWSGSKEWVLPLRSVRRIANQ